MSDSAATGIVLLNGQHEQSTNAMVSGFERTTGIHVTVESDDEDLLADEVVARDGAGGDVIYTENSPALEYLDEHGMLAPVPLSTLSRVPSHFNAPDGRWVGVSARVSVLVYNPRLIAASAVPRRLADLANPRYAGELALAPAETDFQPSVTAYARVHGTAATIRWLEAVKANAEGHIYPDNETITDQVNRGAVAFGIVNQYYWYRLRRELGSANVHSRILFFRPHDPGYVVDVSGAAILRTSRNQAAARRFLAYLVSRQGQGNLVHSSSFEYPISRLASSRPPEPPFVKLQPFPITVGELGNGASARELLTAAGLL